MNRYTTVQNSYVGGILPPEYNGQFNQQLYQVGMAQIDNFIVTSNGTLRKRNGSVIGVKYNIIYNSPPTMPSPITIIKDGAEYKIKQNNQEVAKNWKHILASDDNVSKGVFLIKDIDDKWKVEVFSRIGTNLDRIVEVKDDNFKSDNLEHDDNKLSILYYLAKGYYPQRAVVHKGRFILSDFRNELGELYNMKSPIFFSRVPDNDGERYHDFTLYELVTTTVISQEIKTKKEYITEPKTNENGQFVDNDGNVIANPTPSTVVMESKYIDVKYSEPKTETETKKAIYTSHAINLQENEIKNIVWVASQESLLVIGTENGVFISTNAITPQSVDFVKKDNNGTKKGSRAIIIDNKVTYISRISNKLVNLVFSREQGGYIASPIWIGLGFNIKDIVFSDIDEQVIWFIDENSPYLYGLTKIGNMVALHRHYGGIDGKLEKINFPSLYSNAKLIEVETDTKTYSLMNSIDYELDKQQTIEIVGVENLKGTHTIDIASMNLKIEKVAMYIIKGGVPTMLNITHRNDTMLTYNVPETLEFEATDDKVKIFIGELIKGELIGLPVEMLPASGSSLGKNKRILELNIKMLESYGGEVGTCKTTHKGYEDGFFADYIVSNSILLNRYGSAEYGANIELYTGDYKEFIGDNVNTENRRFYLKNETVYPFELLAHSTTFSIEEV